MRHKAIPGDQHAYRREPSRRRAEWLRYWHLRVSGLLVAWLLIAGCSTPTDAPEPPEPVFSTTAEGDGNALHISTSGDTVLVDVQSRSGIGVATVELVSGVSPANIIVRLHLRGLEALRLSYDHTVIAAAVSSDESHSVFQQLELPDGDTQPIASDSPLWLDIQIPSTSEPSTFPLQPSAFEIRMPNGLLNEERRSFTLRWIDFYR